MFVFISEVLFIFKNIFDYEVAFILEVVLIFETVFLIGHLPFQLRPPPQKKTQYMCIMGCIFSKGIHTCAILRDDLCILFSSSGTLFPALTFSNTTCVNSLLIRPVLVKYCICNSCSSCETLVYNCSFSVQ